MEILCHRGLWKTKASQNKISVILDAFKKGFGVEIDLRLNRQGEIYLAHDREENPRALLSDLFQKLSLSSAFQEYPIMALHIKEDTPEMFDKLTRLVDPTNKLIIFGLSKESKEKYAEVFGWSKIAYELETGLIGSLLGASKGKEGIVWLVERGWSLGLDEYNKIKHKKIYYITPEIIGFKKKLTESHLACLTGICTDDSNFYKDIIDKHDPF